LFRRNKSNSLIGVDISSSAVKMVELGGSMEEPSVKAYAVQSMPRGAYADGHIVKLDEISETLENCLRRCGSSANLAAVAMPTSTVIIKRFIIPSGLAGDELEVRIEAEANQHIPFPLGDVNLDYQIISEEEEVSQVLIVAAKTERVDDQVAVVESCGLKVRVVDVESYTLLCAMQLFASDLKAGPDSVVALVDIGANMITVSIFKDEEALFSRQQPVGGNQLTQEIARHYGMEFAQAETAKLGGTLEDNYEPEILAPFMDNMALEISRALQFFFTSTPYTRVDQILLAGGCATLPGMADVVSTRTQIYTKIANPFERMEVDRGVNSNSLKLDAPSLITACGLAMRCFDPK